ncbi:MAG: hypothetical protein K9N07_05370 [Candidatus Cloacimonetes bacterium]|nr:hypothetical protein [Candidatus Cloacimonadota bacterium]
MKFKNIVFLVLLLIITISVSYFVGIIFDQNIFNISEFGFQLLMFSIVGSFIFFVTKYLRNIDLFITIIVAATFFTLILKNSSWLTIFGGILQLFLYIFMLFAVYAILFRLSWFKFKYIRNIAFSIIEASGFLIVHIIIHLVLHKPIKSSFIMVYFINGIKIMLTLGVSFGIVELVFAKLNKLFFEDPERIKHKTEPENNDQ